jgi:hypothetical protein
MCLLLFLFQCMAAIGNSRFGSSNSRLGGFNSQLRALRELARNGSLWLIFFAAKRRFRREGRQNSRLYGKNREISSVPLARQFSP